MIDFAALRITRSPSARHGAWRPSATGNGVRHEPAINLLLPELRPRFDWLALPVVLGARRWSIYSRWRSGVRCRQIAATARNAALRGRLLALRELGWSGRGRWGRGAE